MKELKADLGLEKKEKLQYVSDRFVFDTVIKKQFAPEKYILMNIMFIISFLWEPSPSRQLFKTY